jgi:hypothetical protein
MSDFKEEKFSRSAHSSKKRDMNLLATKLKNMVVKENVGSVLSSYAAVERRSLIMNHIKLRQDLENIMEDPESADILMTFINRSGANATELVDLIDDAEGKIYVQEIRAKFSPVFEGFLSNHPDDWLAISTRPYYDIRDSYLCLEVKLQKRSGEIVLLDCPADRLATLVGFLLDQLKRTLSAAEIREGAEVSKIFRHAIEIRNNANEIIQQFKPAVSYTTVEKRKILNENDRRILGTRYLESLCNKTRAHLGKKSRFTKREIFGEGILDAYNKDIVIPLIVEKLKQLGYIKEHENDEISLTTVGQGQCGGEVILDESI